MEINEILTMITNQGIGVVCVAYLIYFQSNTMSKMSDVLHQIQVTMETMSERLERVEEKINK